MSRVKTCVIANPTPGFFVVSTIRQEDASLLLVKDPVVAWRISETIDDEDRSSPTCPRAAPICLSEVPADSPVLSPNGSVHEPDSYISWATVDEWLADETKHRACELLPISRLPRPAAPVNPFADASRTLTLKSRSEAER